MIMREKKCNGQGAQCHGCNLPEQKDCLSYPPVPLVTPKETKAGTMFCSECEKLNIAMQLVKALSWRDSRVRIESILGFDNETGTILVDEVGLLKLIQLVNPAQDDRRIELRGSMNK